MEGKLNNIYKNYSIDNLNLDIEVNPNFIKFFGNGKINDSYLEFEGEQKTVNDQIIDKINGKFFYDSKNILTIFPNFLEQASGIVDINFNINNQNDKIKIEGIGDTNQLIVNSKFLGDNLNFKDGKIRFLISPYNKNYSGFFDL